MNGYGIQTWACGTEYRGEFKGDFDGYGLKKFSDNNEYDGQWKQGLKNGEGVFKQASSGKVERRLYEED